MTTEKKTLLKILGGSILAVCSAGIISAAALAKSIEEKYAPQFDADELAKTERLLAVTSHARDIERAAIFEECKATAMKSPYVKKLQKNIADLINYATLPADSLAVVYPGFSAWSLTANKLRIEEKINAEIEKTINATPVMRELNTKINSYQAKRLRLYVARDEYAEWAKLPKKERIKQNLARRKYQQQSMIVQHYNNNVQSY